MKRFRWLLVVAIGWLVAPNLWAAEEPKASDEGKAVIVSGTLVLDNSEEAKPGEKAANPLIKTGKGTLVLSGVGESSPYWVGLNVEAKDSGLVVEGVAPDSPAAKAGIKPHDVLKTVDGKPLKKGEDLVKAVQQAKEKDLAIELMRGDKTEKVTVRPAKRPESGAILEFQLGEGGEGKGGLRFIIEGDEAKKGASTTAAPKTPKRRPQAEDAAKKAMTAAKGAMRERIKRQHELAEKAWQLVQKMESLDEGKPEARETWEQLERIEGQLRQALGPPPGGPAGQGFFNIWTPANPAAGAATGNAANFAYGFATATGPHGPVPPPAWGGMPVPYAPLPGASAKGPPGAMTINSPSGVTVTITATPAPAATAVPPAASNWYSGTTTVAAPPDAAWRRLGELKEKAAQLIQAGEREAAQRIEHEVEALQEALKHMPQFMRQSPPALNPVPRDPSVQELRAQVQDLRHQVERNQGDAQDGDRVAEEASALVRP